MSKTTEKPLTWDRIREGVSVTCKTLKIIAFDSFEIPAETTLIGTFRGCITQEGVLRVSFAFSEYEYPLNIQPHVLSTTLTNARECFLCGIYGPPSDFRRSSLLHDKSPILSQVCTECYRRVKNRIMGHGSLARRQGGKNTLKVSEWLEKLIASEGHCHYCQAQIGYAELITEHMMPLSWKGDNSIENVVPACMSCNSSKGGRDIETWQRSLLAKQLLEELQQHLGLSRYETINLAIKRLAIQEGILVDESEAAA